MDESRVNQTSPFHTWIGVAAADKGPNATTLLVTVPELTPVLTGTLQAKTNTQTIQLSDLEGNAINTNVTSTNAITAYYLGNASNRRYPPDVVRGEQVRVLKYADADRYYWESLGRDDNLRLSETLRLDVANRQSLTDPTGDNHAYSFELDSKRSHHIRLRTSQGGGEAYTYTLILDAQNSQIQLTDNVGNSLLVDSANSKVILCNAKKAFIMLNGLDAVFAAPRDITIKAGRQCLIDTPLLTVNSQSGTGVMAIMANAIALSAKSALTISAPAIGLSGAVQIPNTLTVTDVRAGSYYTGAVSATYAPASINLGAGTGINPAVTPDTTLPANQRHATAWDSFSEALTQIKGFFDQVNAVIGAPVGQASLTTNIAPFIDSALNNIQGT